MLKNNKKGFTLIELLVVIAIIGLLATLAVVALGNARQKSRDAKRVSDIKQIQTALELRYVETDDYPASETSPGTACLGAGGACRLGIEVTSLGTAGWDDAAGQTYMGLVPRDPSASGNLAASTACVAGSTSAGCDYGYLAGTGDYDLWFFLEGDTGGLDVAATGGAVCATQNGISVGACP